MCKFSLGTTAASHRLSGATLLLLRGWCLAGSTTGSWIRRTAATSIPSATSGVRTLKISINERSKVVPRSGFGVFLELLKQFSQKQNAELTIGNLGLVQFLVDDSGIQ